MPRAVAEVIQPHVGRVVIANPRQVRLIAEARIKTDVIDATVLARLYASGFLPEVWVPDQSTLGLRRQVTRRNQIVRQRARLKTIIQSILHAHLVPPCPHADLLGPKGTGLAAGAGCSRRTRGARRAPSARVRPPRATTCGSSSASSRATRCADADDQAAHDDPGHRHGGRGRIARGDRADRSASPGPTSSSPISA